MKIIEDNLELFSNFKGRILGVGLLQKYSQQICTHTFSQKYKIVTGSPAN